MNELITPNEKRIAKKAGKFYLKILKTAGVLLLLGIILTGASFVTSEPAISQVTLDSGDTTYFTQFYAEAGDRMQFVFGINQENGYEYNYETDEKYYNDFDGHYYGGGIDDPWDLVEYMEYMEWYIQVQVEYSESINFETITVVKDVSGEINIVNMELYQDGFYRLKITNQHTEQLSIGILKAEANLALIGTSVIIWILFGLNMALFVMAVHFGLWILMIYILIKALQIILNDRQQSYPQVIGPKDRTEA